MAVGVKNFSTTAATNATADSNINWAENQAPSTVNDSARAMMAALAAFYDQIGGALTVGGSSNAYTITNASPGTWAAYANGDLIMFKANHTNSGAATINVDAIGAKTIKTADGGDVVSGDIVSGGFYLLAYDGTNFQIVNTIGGGSYQPLDATTTAIAALTLDGTNSYIRATGADTFTADTIATFTATLAAMVADSGSGGTKGLVPAPGSGDTAAAKFLRADGTFAVPRLVYAQTAASVNPAVKFTHYGVATGSGAYTITLPASPLNLDAIIVADVGGNAATNNITIAGNGNTINGSASLVIDVNWAWVEIAWDSSGSDWKLARFK